MTRWSLRIGALALGLAVAAPAFAFDWGVSVEDGTTTNYPLTQSTTGTFNQTETLRFWVTQNFGREASLLAKGNLADALVYTFGPGPLTNTVSTDLDTLVYSGYGLAAGRTNFRDFGATVLNTTLDGLQWSTSVPGIDLTLAAGTSAMVFKDQSTVVVSEADLNDRTVTQTWANVATLWAPPRAIAYLEADFTRLAPDQTLRLSELVQYDFRQHNVAHEGDKHDHFSSSGPTAPVSMAYTGLGGGGRLVGSLYWDAWTYLGLGTTLTPTGSFAQAVYNPSTKTTTPAVLQTWKTAAIVNGIGNVDLTLLLPEVAYTIVNFGVMAGSWDPDGISPDQNLPTTPNGATPSLYTGYFGVSRTGSALIFNPQPVNMVITQLLYSFKPFAGNNDGLGNFQVAVSAFAFVRPSTGGIAESGLDPKSSDLYLATEADLNLLFRPASDWGGNVSFGYLAPNTSALTRGTEFKVQAGVNLSL